MNSDLLEGIRRAAQQRIARGIFDAAADSERALRDLAQRIADSCGCAVAHGDRKDRARAVQKVAQEKGGDWLALHDVVRTTILAPDLGALRMLQRTTRSVCSPRHGLGLVRDVELHPSESACGYSGVLFVVRLRSGHHGEIQANLPTVLYGQFGEDRFAALAGWSTARSIRSGYQVQAGIGHPLYEIHRRAPGTEPAQAAAALSRRYFDHLRGLPDGVAGRALQADIETFRRAHPVFFQPGG